MRKISLTVDVRRSKTPLLGPAITDVSPRSSPLGEVSLFVSPRETFPSGDERGETSVFAGYLCLSSLITPLAGFESTDEVLLVVATNPVNN